MVRAQRRKKENEEWKREKSTLCGTQKSQCRIVDRCVKSPLNSVKRLFGIERASSMQSLVVPMTARLHDKGCGGWMSCKQAHRARVRTRFELNVCRARVARQQCQRPVWCRAGGRLTNTNWKNKNKLRQISEARQAKWMSSFLHLLLLHDFPYALLCNHQCYASCDWLVMSHTIFAFALRTVKYAFDVIPFPS